MSPVWDWVSLATESTKYVGHEKFSAWTFTVRASTSSTSTSCSRVEALGLTRCLIEQMGYATVSLYFQSDSTPRWFIVDGDYRSTSLLCSVPTIFSTTWP